MDVTHPINTLIPSLAGAVLEVLAGTTRPLSGRQVARLVAGGATQKGVQKVLDELAHGGLVIQEEAGSAILNLLNRHHLLAPLVVEAARGYRSFLDELGRTASELQPQPERAVLFGSVARREAGPGSDVDIALVWSDALSPDAITNAEAALRTRVEELTGNRCQIVSYRHSEFSNLAATAPEFAENLTKDGLDVFPRSDQEHLDT